MCEKPVLLIRSAVWDNSLLNYIDKIEYVPKKAL